VGESKIFGEVIEQLKRAEAKLTWEQVLSVSGSLRKAMLNEYQSNRSVVNDDTSKTVADHAVVDHDGGYGNATLVIAGTSRVPVMVISTSVLCLLYQGSEINVRVFNSII
jgi:hypothetical protein